MIKFIIINLLGLLPIFLFAQKTKLIAIKYYKSEQVKRSFYVLKKNKNIKHGTFQSFYENGALKEKGEYANNLKIGEWKEFNPIGEIQKVKIYNKGKKLSEKKVGIWSASFEKGQVIKRYDYDNDQTLETLFNISVRYPDSARDNNIQGFVKVKLILDLDCNVQEIIVVKSLDADCNEAALESIKKMAELIKKYDKTKCTGIEMIIPVHFKLD